MTLSSSVKDNLAIIIMVIVISIVFSIGIEPSRTPSGSICAPRSAARPSMMGSAWPVLRCEPTPTEFFALCTRRRRLKSGSGMKSVYLALEYHTLILFFLKEPLWKRSLYFFLPGYLKAQFTIYLNIEIDKRMNRCAYVHTHTGTQSVDETKTDLCWFLHGIFPNFRVESERIPCMWQGVASCCCRCLRDKASAAT